MDLSELILTPGSHRDRSDGVCAIEACAWLAGERHSTTCHAVDPTLREMVMMLNDMGRDCDRDRLKYYLPHLLHFSLPPGAHEEVGQFFADVNHFVGPVYLMQSLKTEHMTQFQHEMYSRLMDAGFALLDKWLASKGESVGQTDLHEHVLV